MARIRADYVFGTTSAALTATDTTLSSSALTRLPAVASPDTAAVILYDNAAGNYEIVTVTAHTASATTATVTRGQEGSTAQAWASGATWQHGPTVRDFSTGILGQVSYYPATQVTFTPTTTNSDVDATNLAVTFNAPASGTVYVTFDGTMNQNQLGGILLCLREGTTVIPKTRVRRAYLASSGANQVGIRASWVVSGLTPGSSHTYKLGYEKFGSGSSSLTCGDEATGWGPLNLVVSATAV